MILFKIAFSEVELMTREGSHILTFLHEQDCLLVYGSANNQMERSLMVLKCVSICSVSAVVSQPSPSIISRFGSKSMVTRVNFKVQRRLLLCFSEVGGVDLTHDDITR